MDFGFWIHNDSFLVLDNEGLIIVRYAAGSLSSLASSA